MIKPRNKAKTQLSPRDGDRFECLDKCDYPKCKMKYCALNSKRPPMPPPDRIPQPQRRGGTPNPMFDFLLFAFAIVAVFTVLILKKLGAI